MCRWARRSASCTKSFANGCSTPVTSKSVWTISRCRTTRWRTLGGGTLHRNFMGYTDRRTTALLGLGVSAISETPACYHQNEKVITVYERRVARVRCRHCAGTSSPTTIGIAPTRSAR